MGNHDEAGRRPKAREEAAMSLRAFFSTVVGGLVLLTMVSATLLVVLTTALERMASTLSESVEGVRQAEELEVDLLIHSRLLMSPGAPMVEDPSRGRSAPQIESDVRRQLVEMHAIASTDEERRSVSDVQWQVYAYLGAQQKPPGSEVSQAQHETTAMVLLDAALRSLERLIQINVDQAQEARRSAAHWSEMADLLGLLLGLLLLTTLGLVVFWLRRFALRPVTELRSAMAGFGRGGRHLRAPEEGPLEIRDMADRKSVV